MQVWIRPRRTFDGDGLGLPSVSIAQVLEGSLHLLPRLQYIGDQYNSNKAQAHGIVAATSLYGTGQTLRLLARKTAAQTLGVLGFSADASRGCLE